MSDGGAPAILVRDSREQTVSRADAERVSQTLFGSVDQNFVANATAPGAFSLAVIPNPQNFSGGTFRARFKLVSGATDQTAGLVFDLRPNGEYKYVRYNTKDGDVALWRFASGQRHLIVHGKEHAQLPLNAWHELSLTITGNKLVAAANDKIKLEHMLDAPVQGRIGFWTKRDSETMFKDVRIHP